MREGKINGIWPIVMAEHRIEFHDARPKWERGRLESCAELMQPGMVVYDVGAEEGDFTSWYKILVGDAGTVVPIEPQPAYWPAIRQTWEANDFNEPPRVWWPGFAGGDTTLHEFTDELEWQGWPHEPWPRSSVGEMIPDVGFKHLAQQVDEVPQVRLDAFADISGVPPDAIVMDIEGAEYHALAGCEELLKSKRPLIWVSVHEGTMWDWYGRTWDDLHDLMAGYDYSWEELPYNGEAERFELYVPA